MSLWKGQKAGDAHGPARSSLRPGPSRQLSPSSVLGGPGRGLTDGGNGPLDCLLYLGLVRRAKETDREKRRSQNRGAGQEETSKLSQNSFQPAGLATQHCRRAERGLLQGRV